MEDKLLSLKEQFCNWYCSNKLEHLRITNKSSKCSEYQDCNKCNDKLFCENNLCEYCIIENFIAFVRDEL